MEKIARVILLPSNPKEGTEPGQDVEFDDERAAIVFPCPKDKVYSVTPTSSDRSLSLDDYFERCQKRKTYQKMIFKDGSEIEEIIDLRPE